MRRAWLLGLALWATAGCVAYEIPADPLDSPAPYSPYLKKEERSAEARGPNAPAVAEAPEEERPAGAPSAATLRGASVDPAALRKVMSELQSLGDVDQETQRQLLADLEQTDPALWPVLMQTFRAGLAYRQKQAEEKAAAAVERSAAAEVASIASSPETAGAPQASVPTALSFATPAAPPASSNPALSTLPQLDALQGLSGARGANTPGLAMPAQMLLSAALAEAQRQMETSPTTSAPQPRAQASTVGPSAAAPQAKPSEQVEPATTTVKAEQPEAGAWRSSLEAAIAQLEPLTHQPPTNAAEVTRHAWLHVLYLAAGRREEALRPIPGIAAAEQDFWSEQLYALSTYLDAEKLTDPAARSAEARRHLAKAETRLAEAGNLAVRNLAFCTEVSSYGVYEKFKETEFKPGRPLILYAEVDNFKSEETEKGFHTALRSSYQILDAQGRRVAENDLALTEEYCRNRRRDYFIRYFLTVPERIYAGKYVLQLTLVDTLSGKIGQATIDFTVGDEAK